MFFNIFLQITNISFTAVDRFYSIYSNEPICTYDICHSLFYPLDGLRNNIYKVFILARLYNVRIIHNIARS